MFHNTQAMLHRTGQLSNDIFRFNAEARARSVPGRSRSATARMPAHLARGRHAPMTS